MEIDKAAKEMYPFVGFSWYWFAKSPQFGGGVEIDVAIKDPEKHYALADPASYNVDDVDKQRMLKQYQDGSCSLQ